MLQHFMLNMLDFVPKTFRFDPIHFSNLLYSFATLRLPGPPGILGSIAETAAEHVHRFDAGNLAIAAWALAMLGMKEQHLLDLAIDRVAGLVVYVVYGCFYIMMYFVLLCIFIIIYIYMIYDSYLI